MNPIKAIVNKIADEPAVTVGVIIAAANTVTDQTWQGYTAAVLAALIRFAVTPVTRAA